MQNILCAKCDRVMKEGYEYIATVHTVSTWDNEEEPQTWCEDCCDDNGMCKCGGCSVEFTEEFRMPRIRSELYCVPCAREIAPKHFQKTPIYV